MLHRNLVLSTLLLLPAWVVASPYYTYPNHSTVTTTFTVTSHTTVTVISCPTTQVYPVCGNGKVEAGEECDEGALNGSPGCHCTSDCKKKKTDEPPVVVTDVCAACDPNPFFNKCTITTSCIGTPSKKNYCACRAGYRADGLSPTDSRQFRLNFPGQEYRVFVAPGVGCDTLCTTPFPGPDSCKEVPVKTC